MGLLGKRRNRRRDKVRRLDVSLRNERVREQRVRVLGVGFGLLFGVIVVGFGVWRGGEWLLDRFVFASDQFAIQTIETSTDGVIAPQHIERWADVRNGQNLMALNLWEVKRNLQLVPAIRWASVERAMPHTLRIRVSEREPIAQVVALRNDPKLGPQPRVFHVDVTGFVMAPVDRRLAADPASLPDDSLPALVGVSQAEFVEGRVIESAAVRAALRLIDSFEASPMSGVVDLRRIDVSAPDVITVQTGAGSEVTFAPGDLERQLRRWREIHDFGIKSGRQVAAADLSVTHNIPVRWLESTGAPPQNPPPVKPQRQRRKHV